MKCKMSRKLCSLHISWRLMSSWLTLQIEYFIIMALEVFSSIRYWIKPEDISIDNWIFKLHYKFSTAILLGSSAIGVAKQYFGDPINCQVMRFPKIPQKIRFTHIFIPFYLHNFWTTMQITLFENYSKCRIWIFYFGIFYQFLSH